MPDSADQPIMVNASPAKDMATSAVRSGLLLLGAVTAIAGFVSKHDLAGFIAYVQSSDFITVLAMLIGLGSFLWGQWKTRRRAQQLVTVATSPEVPDHVAAIKP